MEKSYTVAVKTLSPLLAVQVQKIVQDALAAIERTSSDNATRRAAAYAANHTKIEMQAQ